MRVCVWNSPAPRYSESICSRAQTQCLPFEQPMSERKKENGKKEPERKTKLRNTVKRYRVEIACVRLNVIVRQEDKTWLLRPGKPLSPSSRYSPVSLQNATLRKLFILASIEENVACILCSVICFQFIRCAVILKISGDWLAFSITRQTDRLTEGTLLIFHEWKEKW